MSQPVLKIVQAGDPVLRAGTSPIPPSEIREPDVQRLVELMRETMRDAPGVGLAAPQVGVGLAVCVIEDSAKPSQLTAEQLRERGRKPVPFHALFNPTLEIVGADVERWFEGCLSIDGMTAIVPRAKKVRVHALDHKGKAVTIDASGWYARILQHEIDHLNGMLYVDRMAPRTFMSSDAHARRWRGVDIEAVELALSGPPEVEPEDVIAKPATASRARARRPSPGR